MITCKVGEMGCILTRKILIGVILLIATIVLLIYRIQTLPETTFQGYHHHHEPYKPIEDTWQQFLQNCGRDKFFNTIQNEMKCYHQYMDRTVEKWSGKPLFLTTS